MIIFGTVSAYPEKLATQCAPGIARSMNGEAYEHIVERSVSNTFLSYQGIMLAARDRFNDAGSEAGDGDALVLVHDDLEFRDPKLATKVAANMDKGIGIVGLIGSKGAKSLAWWEGDRRGRVTDDAYGLHDFPFGDVDTLDGMCLILSPWACGRLFLSGQGKGLHGYADELCFQARKFGKRVVAADITAHHHSKGGYAGGVESFNEANANFQKRWLT